MYVYSADLFTQNIIPKTPKLRPLRCRVEVQSITNTKVNTENVSGRL